MATFSAKAAAVLGACAVVMLAIGCDEDGKTAPERCSTLPAPFDLQAGAPPADDNRSLNPGSGGENGLPDCVTEVGHAISSTGVAGDGSVAGSSGSGTGGSSTGGTSSGGSSANGGDTGTAGAADAGAGGA